MSALSGRRRRSPADLVAAARDAGVRDERVLAAIAAVPRAAFVPRRHAGGAYLDEPLRITHGQVTTQPSLVARMVEALVLGGAEKVLEVGTGYGWQTALLARLAAEVWSIERWADMTDAAGRALAAQGIGNVQLVVGDGTLGLPAQAPFDAIVVTAAFPTVPPPLAGQLVRGGRLVQPIGPGGSEDVVLFRREERGLIAVRSLTAARFVPLYGAYGHGAAPADERR